LLPDQSAIADAQLRKFGEDQVTLFDLARPANRLGWLSGIILSAFVFGSTFAQDFPSAPIKIVVGFGAGGLGDMVSRIVADKMSASLGKPVIIENMPGAGGITAAIAAARAAPDGYTMLLVSGQNAVSPSLFKTLPYDMTTSFSMVSTVGLFNFVIMVAKNSPYHNVQDLIAAAKRDPTHFNIGTISFGSVQNLSALLFVSMTGLEVPTVPFKTTGEVQAAVMSGQVQASFETLPGAIGQIRSGVLRPLAVTSKRRLSYLADVPTVAESGVPDFELQSWDGFVVPAKTPRDIIVRLNKEIGIAVAAPDVQKRFIDIGLSAYASSPEEMQQFYDTDVVRWRKVVAEAKVHQ
jgi:tripartite-type tricarboxylate transporter receptor subunit TctC